ncbi:hypothetical protein AB0C31_48575, partial [Actinoplanes philippinensis]
MRKRTIAAAVAGAVVVTVLKTGTGSAAVVQSQAGALRSRVALHLDAAAGQMPENIVLGPDGTAYVTFAGARQVAAIDRT